MNQLSKIISNITDTYQNSVIPTSVIASVLLVVLILGIYEFAVYRLVSHRAFYNRSFHICITVLPFFIATIILCLQSNIVITLGTIGALAILRFRAAVKDPVDMLYLLWSVHIGITCGCQLYEVAVLTSLMVTLVLFALEYIKIGKKPYVLVFRCQEEQADTFLNLIRTFSKSYRVKSRNYTVSGIDFVIELSVKEPQQLTSQLKAGGLEQFSLIEYDCDDIL